MKTVTLEVASKEDVTRRALDAFRGEKRRTRISFATPGLLWKVFTAQRWELLKAMAGQGPLTIREVARRVGRDVKQAGRVMRISTVRESRDKATGFCAPEPRFS